MSQASRKKEAQQWKGPEAGRPLQGKMASIESASDEAALPLNMQLEVHLCMMAKYYSRKFE